MHTVEFVGASWSPESAKAWKELREAVFCLKEEGIDIELVAYDSTGDFSLRRDLKGVEGEILPFFTVDGKQVEPEAWEGSLLAGKIREALGWADQT